MRRTLPLLLTASLAVGAVPALARTAGRADLVTAPAAVTSDAPLTRAIATFAAVPTAADLAPLETLGLAVQPMEHLPLAIVEGPADVLAGVPGLRPDDRLQYFWDESVTTMTGDVAHDLGFTGEGVQVAVVDSGIDGTHPDLADHVVHNVKLFSGEYANQPPDPATPDDPYLVVPMDQGPYNNTDNTSGHGTHVAGIIAADGTTDPSQVGVAPDAELIGYAIGEVLFTTAVITAYDHILDNPEWGIDVVNNSWGSQFLAFDPTHPINVATKAVADTGVVVVFAAGNSGDGETEMTINPFSVAPWVLSVASGDVERNRSSFSSNGLVVDNSTATGMKDGHVRFEGDRLGQYHPDVAAPGSDIVSSGTTTVAVGPTEPGGTTAASGTSMATPHVAGAAAVLLSAKPDLTPKQVQDVLAATAVPMEDGSPFWQVGFGHVDLGAAVRAVLDGVDVAAELSRDRARLMAAREWTVRSSDLWTWDALPVTVGGADSRTVEVDVPAETDAVKVTLAHPSLATVGANGFQYDVAIADADGDVVGTGVEAAGAGTVTALVEVGGDATPGTWTVTVTGQLGAADPDTIDNESLASRMATLQVAQVDAQAPTVFATPHVPEYRSTAKRVYFFTADDGDVLPLPSPEGCATEAGAPSGVLSSTAPAADATCQSGATGWTVSRTAGMPATFSTEPFSSPVLVGGAARITAHIVDELAPVHSSALTGVLAWTVSAVAEDGTVTLIGEGEADAVAGRNSVRIDVPPGEVPAGSRLQLTVAYSSSPAGAPTNTARFVYGGGDYADAGFAISTGVID